MIKKNAGEQNQPRRICDMNVSGTAVRAARRGIIRYAASSYISYNARRVSFQRL